MSYENGCGSGYCFGCGDCFDDNDRRMIMEGYCLRCKKKVPWGTNLCPFCYEYVFRPEQFGLKRIEEAPQAEAPGE